MMLINVYLSGLVFLLKNISASLNNIRFHFFPSCFLGTLSSQVNLQLSIFVYFSLKQSNIAFIFILLYLKPTIYRCTITLRSPKHLGLLIYSLDQFAKFQNDNLIHVPFFVRLFLL